MPNLDFWLLQGLLSPKSVPGSVTCEPHTHVHHLERKRRFLRCCRDLKENGLPQAHVWMFVSHLVDYVEMIRGCGLVGKDVPLEMGLEVSKAQARLSLAFFVSYLRIGCIAPMPCLPAYLTHCLPACHYASCHDKQGLNLWNLRKLLIKCISPSPQQ